MELLTEEFVDRCENACKVEVERLIYVKTPSGSDQVLHFDAAVLSNLLALYILTPFVISVTANFASLKLNSKWIKEQPARKLRHAIQQRVGAELRVGDPAAREECVIIVEELLKPYGVGREEARRMRVSQQ